MDKNYLSDFPLISVVVLTYNSSKTIIETLDSIKFQTYPNIELIITDDGSKDDTLQKCRNWIEENESRFIGTKVLSVDVNTGIPANCNRGIRAGTGSLIKLIAGDDALMLNCLSQNAEYILKRLEIEILLSQMEIFENNLNPSCTLGVWRSGALTDFFPDHITASQQYEMLLFNDRVGNTPTVFLRSSIFEKIGLYDEEFPFIEDYPFWLKATKAGIKVYFMDLVTVKYRKHNLSVFNTDIVYFTHPSYFRNEGLRKKYIYPNLGFWTRLHRQYCYHMARAFKFLTGNKYNPIVSKFFNFITFQSNFYSKLFQS